MNLRLNIKKVLANVIKLKDFIFYVIYVYIYIYIFLIYTFYFLENYP